MKILKAFEVIDYTLDEIITLIKKGKFPYLALVGNELYDFTGNIGCVYPDGEESYFIDSNLQQCINIEAQDGCLFAEIDLFEKQILKAFKKIDYTLDEVITLIKKGKFPYLALVYNELYDFTGNIGCVYPYGEEGYFINSNLQQCINVEAKDGFLFAEIVPFERQRK